MPPYTRMKDRALVQFAQSPSGSKGRLIVAPEREWRRPPSVDECAPLTCQFLASRWIDYRTFAREVAIVHGDDHHTICLALRSTNLALEVAGCLAHDGPVTAGAIQISAPGASVQGLLREPCDFLHLRVANWFLMARSQELEAPPWTYDRFSSHFGFTHDAVVVRLSQALLAARASTGDLHSGYVDSITLAIVTRLLTRPDVRSTTNRSHQVSTLAKWRLKRTVDYIDAHLAEPIQLGDMATAAGLSRMHFAAQFRAATGCRPREYLLRRRIDRAKDLLATTGLALVDIALCSGFSNQAHFSTVFARLVGQTPARWRRANRSANVVPNRKVPGVPERPPYLAPQELRENGGANA
jgi:AraC family transcriptional regulator